MQLGAPIAVGSRSTIHEWGTDAVAKVPLPSTPDGWIESEARFTSIVRRSGAPVPELLGLEMVGGRVVSLYERIRGRSMWAHMVERPDRVPALAESLAALQVRLFTLEAPLDLPRQIDRITCKIRVAAALLDDALLAALSAVPTIDEHRLCHGDFHPGNVIMGTQGPTIVDWFDVARGTSSADVARSLLLMEGDRTGTEAPQHLPGATPTLLAQLGAAYRSAIDELMSPDPDVVEHWMAIAAVTRLAEGVSPASLLRRWERWSSRPQSRVGCPTGDMR